MDPKPRPNHQLYLQALDHMGPSRRAAKAFELSDMAKAAFRAGLRRRFPDLTDTEFHALFLQQLERCHNRNY